MRIWIDADACPKIVKEIIFKTSHRLNIPVTLVANSMMAIPHSPLINIIKVDKGDDVADQYIVDQVSTEDLVVTADIPLAALVVEKQAIAINPRGELYTEDNVREKLSMRDFMKELRDSGMDNSGPSSYGAKDKEQFANAFNSIITKMMKTYKTEK